MNHLQRVKILLLVDWGLLYDCLDSLIKVGSEFNQASQLMVHFHFLSVDLSLISSATIYGSIRSPFTLFR